MDDDPAIIGMMKLIIVSIGHRVVATSNGDDAVKKYVESVDSGEMFDLVILDYHIDNGMGGEKTLQALARINPDIVAIISSGSSDLVPDGFRAALPKPFLKKDLKCMIDNLLA